jgi:hypothetical protein
MSLKDINKILAAAQTDLVFAPTPDMRRVKAAFWSKTRDNPNLVDSASTLTSIQQTVSDKRLTKWWSLPGFSEWFQNGEEYRERMEYLADLALDALEQVLVDPDANASAKVASAKLVLEAASKMPTKDEAAPASRLETMSRAELEAYVSRHLKYLSAPLPAEPLTNDAPADKVDESVP